MVSTAISENPIAIGIVIIHQVRKMNRFLFRGARQCLRRTVWNQRKVAFVQEHWFCCAINRYPAMASRH